MVVNSMSYATYDSYKDSGVDWLGEIPSDWILMRFKYIFKEINDRSETGAEELLSVSQYTGVTKRANNVSTEILTNAESLEGYKKVKQNQLVSNIMLAWNGSLAFSKFDGIVSPAYAVYELNNNFDNRFFNYLVRSETYKAEYKRKSTGVVESRLRLYTENFYSIWCAFPEPSEQERISNFLDQKTAQIDQAIALKQQQIEKLGEYKQIVIQNAVTKGLNPNAPMKNSGVEWIGNIPEHWDVKKLKYLTSKIGSGITPSGGATTYVDKGIPLLRSQNIHFDGLVLDNVANISLNVHKSMKNSQVKQHDVLLNITGGSLGRCCYNSSNDEMNVNQHVCIVRPNNLIKGEFLNGLMSSEVGQKQIWFFQQGGGREGLNFQNLKNFDFPLPSIDEQKEIIAHIEILKQHFKKSVDNYQTQIDRLKEYKNILINQAVTGKIKI